jgi:hypothetical protein
MYLYTDQRKNDSSRLAQLPYFEGLELPPIIPILPTACSRTRACCMLAPFWVIDPLSLGVHHSMGEKNGIIYTGGAGFIDTSHVRHCCDDTKRVYDQLVASGGSPTQVITSNGNAKIIKSIPANMWTKVARAISYSDSVGYEIETYWESVGGGHNSAFSPEDFSSNYFGTFIAETAINTRVVGPGSNFDATVTATLNAFLTVLKAQTIVETQKAFSLIMGCWMSPNPQYTNTSLEAWGNMTLKRRNFRISPIVPWKVGHSSDFPTPAWLTQGLGAASSYFAYTYDKTPNPQGRSSSPTPMPEDTYIAELVRIHANAKATYGDKYAQPTCP